MTSPIDHPVLGRFTYDPSPHWYEGRAMAGSVPIAIYVPIEDEETPALDAVVPVVANLDRLRAEAEAHAAAGLLAPKNEAWLDEGEAEETEESFRAKLRLESVSVEPDGAATFSFDDGGLFWGHTVLVFRGPDGTWEGAETAG